MAAHADRIRRVGYTVVPSGLSREEIPDLSRRLDRVMDRQVDEFGREGLATIGDTLTARCRLAYDDAFLRLATHPEVLAISRALIGEYVVLTQQNGIINPAGQTHTQLAYHRRPAAHLQWARCSASTRSRRKREPPR